MLKELRTTHQEQSFATQSTKLKSHQQELVRSPLFSPFSNLSMDGSNLMSSTNRLSSIRNPRRESMGSAVDPFDRYVHAHSVPQENTVAQEESVNETTAFQYERDDSRMSIDSSPSDVRHPSSF
jgi:hypothetical protein